MEKYVDGYVIPIARNKVEDYKRMAELAGSIWKEHGALAYVECIGDDLNQEGFISFNQAANAVEGETVIFSWIVFESQQHRDRVNQAVMSDSRLKEMMNPDSGPFDCKRMIYGGFRTIVDI